MADEPRFSVDSLPAGSHVTFADSSFFTRNGPGALLPDPKDILAQQLSKNPKYLRLEGPAPVIYKDLGLVVKLGTEPAVTIAEGQCLWAVRKHLPQVPVPEVYGWTKEGDHVFLYMELIDGLPLEERWDNLGEDERTQVCGQLRAMFTQMRQLRQDSEDSFLGAINRDPYTDVMFTNGVLPRAGPFSSVPDFHDWLSLMIREPARMHFPGVPVEDIPDPYRQKLPDNARVVFTHADLHPSNIMVSRESPCAVIAIVDWAQSGWYPDYWEYCKSLYAVDQEGEWATEYIPRFLQKPTDESFDGFEDYARAYGF
ncbi:hypothetical protein HJFPF1_05160 [Paramyrothecium foliicola]|nr:hypothetical protein HJFPF1_05160 [Paramyrothecium foliicola]